MAHTRVWEEAAPVGTEDVSLGDDRIRNLKVDLGERLEVMLYGFNISDGTGDEATPGVKVLNFKEQASIATPSANQINIASKVGVDGDAKAQLWAEDEDGNERQLTKTSGSALRLNVKAGDYAADSIDQDDIRLANNASLTGRNNAGDGDVNVIKVNTSDEVELGAVTKLPDTSKLATSGAPTADAQLANKKYIDDQDKDLIGTGVSKSKDTNYTAATSGTLVVMGTDTWDYNVTHTILVKSDDNATPTTVVGKAGGKCTRADSANNIVYHTITVPIIKAKKYRVEDVGAVIDSITFYPNQ